MMKSLSITLSVAPTLLHSSFGLGFNSMKHEFVVVTTFFQRGFQELLCLRWKDNQRPSGNWFCLTLRLDVYGFYRPKCDLIWNQEPYWMAKRYMDEEKTTEVILKFDVGQMNIVCVYVYILLHLLYNFMLILNNIYDLFCFNLSSTIKI